MSPATCSSPEDFSRYELSRLQSLAAQLQQSCPGSPILTAVNKAIALKVGRTLPPRGDD